jgi:hypothetical protein
MLAPTGVIQGHPQLYNDRFQRRHYGFSESEGDTRANCERQTASRQRAAMSGPNIPKKNPPTVKALVVVPAAEVGRGGGGLGFGLGI